MDEFQDVIGEPDGVSAVSWFPSLCVDSPDALAEERVLLELGREALRSAAVFIHLQCCQQNSCVHWVILE